jgi:hypothetical protein
VMGGIVNMVSYVFVQRGDKETNEWQCVGIMMW